MSTTKKQELFKKYLDEMNDLTNKSTLLANKLSNLNQDLEKFKQEMQKVQNSFDKGELTKEVATKKAEDLKSKVQNILKECDLIENQRDDLNKKIAQNLKNMFSIK